jgi:hypothetical protein
MALSGDDKQFRLPKISLLDFKTIEMDRVLTCLFARMQHKGEDGRLFTRDNTIETFLAHFGDKKDAYRDFGRYPGIARGWLESHLLDLVNRGKVGKQAVAAPRPLHGYTYRFRNPKHCRDYGAAQHIYESLCHADAVGERALAGLRSFFFEGIDQNTQKPEQSAVIDVETQALWSLNQTVVTQDAPAIGSREAIQPLCQDAAALMADDLLRLLQYRSKIPRSVMVEYLKILLAFHMALYHLRLFKFLPELVKNHGRIACDGGQDCPGRPGLASALASPCPSHIGLLLDVQNRPGTAIAELAQASAELHYRRIPRFIHAYFITRKLDEYATLQLQLGRIPGGARRAMSVGEVLELLDPEHDDAREQYFAARVISLRKSLSGEDEVPPPEIEAAMGMGLGYMDTFIECLMAMRGDFHRSFIVRCLDSLLLKHRAGALLAQGRARNAARRFILDSRLLEVLLQVAVLRFRAEEGRYVSEEIQIDRLLAFLRDRYGLFIDELPVGEGFADPSVADREALRMNKVAFKNKLREIGFFQDLSDAYVTQHVTPRYRVGHDQDRVEKGAS